MNLSPNTLLMVFYDVQAFKLVENMKIAKQNFTANNFNIKLMGMEICFAAHNIGKN